MTMSQQVDLQPAFAEARRLAVLSAPPAASPGTYQDRDNHELDVSDIRHLQILLHCVHIGYVCETRKTCLGLGLDPGSASITLQQYRGAPMSLLPCLRVQISIMS